MYKIFQASCLLALAAGVGFLLGAACAPRVSMEKIGTFASVSGGACQILKVDMAYRDGLIVQCGTGVSIAVP